MGGHEASGATKYHSLHDVPDELVNQYSKRDPDNKLYQTRRWVNFKKRQILFQQRDGVPIHLRTPLARFVYYGTWTASIALLFTNLYLLNNLTSKKK